MADTSEDEAWHLQQDLLEDHKPPLARNESAKRTRESLLSHGTPSCCITPNLAVPDLL